MGMYRARGVVSMHLGSPGLFNSNNDSERDIQ